ncbi:MAG TPA: SDR family NAD(P)-dependent oxidoreductase, partial [Gemmatimonadales bacterium]|nr:SDR family NAD(P)-dependent oxidoreductase [Gemmatimonadales bacterium]
GGLDLVVAAAGRDEPTPGELVTWGQVRRLFDLNVVGAAATLLPLVPRMRGRGRGHLVAISSLAAQCPLPGGAPYGASKAALSYLLEALADDLAPLGIAVTLVEPGFVETPMTARHPFPMPFAVSADRAAAVIDRAIRRRVRRVRFPWPLVLLVRLGGLVPARLRAAILRWAVPRACGTAGVEGLSP